MKTRFLHVCIAGKPWRAKFMRLYASADDAVMTLDYDRAKRSLSRMDRIWHGRSCEGELLKAAMLVARGKQADYAKALEILLKLENGLVRRRKKSSSYFRDEIATICVLLAKVRYWKASCFYYSEKDRESLAAFRKCITTVNGLSAKSRRTLYPGFVPGFVPDVQHKILSLEFSVSRDGLCKAEKLLRLGKDAEVRELVGEAASRCCVAYLDHRAITIYAIANFIGGDLRRGRTLIERDYEYNNKCLDTRFVYAVSHIGCRRSSLNKTAFSILREIADGVSDSSCPVSRRKVRKMEMVARSILQPSQRNAALFGANANDAIARRSRVAKYLRFVYVVPFYDRLTLSEVKD